MKNKGCVIAGIVAAGLLLIVISIFAWGVGKYNTMVELRSGETGYEKAWADVESQYQRRSDLIPNLVATVKGYATHEEKTLTEVIEARAAATQMTVDPSQLSPAAIEKFQASQGQLSQALGRLMVVEERYPDLKANENFRELSSQLEGTENRIQVARQRYNEAASRYNSYIMKFPGNIIAGITGFEKSPLFKADEAAATAPKVEF
jgi:LemA protein